MRHLEYPEIPFHALLQRAAERYPEKTAIVFGDRRVSFLELDRLTNQVAGAFLDMGVIRGDRIALYLPNCPEYEITFFAATRAGAVPTPLNPSYKEREVRHQIADAGAVVLVVHASLYANVAAIRGHLPSLRRVILVGGPAVEGTETFSETVAGRSTSPPDLDIDGEDLAALPYSSGTTGMSKGVMLTHRNLVRNAYQFIATTETTDEDVLIIFLPLYHIYGVALMAFAVATGARQVLMERFDLGEVLGLIKQEGVTELYVVPPVMLALANTPDLMSDQFQTIRFVMSAAAPLAPEVGARASDRLDLTVIQAYGMTESSPLTHMVPLESGRALMGSVGVPAPDTECRIVDMETGDELPASQVGEVSVRGPQVMAGYWNAPDETSQILRDGWLLTGDIGKVDEHGNLYIVDRKKEMIKYKAFSIAPAELEALLLEHPAVADCAVVGRPDPEAGEVPHAFLVLAPGATVTPEELQRFVRDRAASYKQIRFIDIVEAIPRTPSGKILRRVLKAQTQQPSPPPV